MTVTLIVFCLLIIYFFFVKNCYVVASICKIVPLTESGTKSEVVSLSFWPIISCIHCAGTYYGDTKMVDKLNPAVFIWKEKKANYTIIIQTVLSIVGDHESSLFSMIIYRFSPIALLLSKFKIVLFVAVIS